MPTRSESVSILEKINKSSLKLLYPLSLPETYKTIFNEARKLVAADMGSLILEQEGQLQRVFISDKILEGLKRRKKGYTQKSFSTQKALVVDGATYSKKYPQIRPYNFKYTIFIPLANQGKSIGVLILNTKKNKRYTQRDLGVLKVFGSMASLAIRKAQLYDELNRAVDTRDLFISMAAHEIRTPLTTINGYVQLLTKRFENKNIPEADWTREMSWECYRLNLLVNELLEINRIRSGKLTYNWSECNLRELIRRAITNFNFGHSGKKLTYIENKNLEFDNVIGDFDKLLQVLTNLLDNAAKFSLANKEITLRLGYRYPNFHISVTNYGIGIDKKDAAKVFEQFYKGSEHIAGLGLGLYLSKNIVERHKGKISIASDEGKTTVTVTLPKAKV